MTLVWLDCDPGHDDAFAILLAAMHPDLNLIGISTVHGNASNVDTCWNALSILTSLNKHEEVPVFVGSPDPFCREPLYAPDIHGPSGLDGATLVFPGTQPKGTAIIDMCALLMRTPPGLVWLVATGALTNIAILMRNWPAFRHHIAGLCVMGGAVGDNFTNVTNPGDRFGNVSPSAEFNIYCDPESAQSVFSDPVLSNKTFLITLDLTHQVLAHKTFQESILYGPEGRRRSPRGQPSEQRQLFHDLLVFFADMYAEKFNLQDGPPLHDVLAVALVIDGFFPRRPIFPRDDVRYNVQVVTAGRREDPSAEVGRTIVTRSQDGKGVRIPRMCDRERVFSLLNQCLEIMDEHLRGTEPLEPAVRVSGVRRGMANGGPRTRHQDGEV